jgi:excisionase family DNA binding protein
MRTEQVISSLLTARQVSERLNVSLSTVMRWTKAGDIPVIRMPTGTLRYRETAIADWIEERAA